LVEPSHPCAWAVKLNFQHSDRRSGSSPPGRCHWLGRGQPAAATPSFWWSGWSGLRLAGTLASLGANGLHIHQLAPPEPGVDGADSMSRRTAIRTARGAAEATAAAEEAAEEEAAEEEAAEEEAAEEEQEAAAERRSCCWAASEPMWPPLLLLFAESEDR
jgi:hypothetical protein